jgi:hypothetical protein
MAVSKLSGRFSSLSLPSYESDAGSSNGQALRTDRKVARTYKGCRARKLWPGLLGVGPQFAHLVLHSGVSHFLVVFLHPLDERLLLLVAHPNYCE